MAPNNQSGGVISGLAYALVLYAKTLAPLGIVSALRETSVIFAALIGVIWFKEGPRRPRLIAGCVVATGIVATVSLAISSSCELEEAQHDRQPDDELHGAP